MLVCVHIYNNIIISTVKMKFTSASKMNKKEENIEEMNEKDSQNAYTQPSPKITILTFFCSIWSMSSIELPAAARLHSNVACSHQTQSAFGYH